MPIASSEQYAAIVEGRMLISTAASFTVAERFRMFEPGLQVQDAPPDVRRAGVAGGPHNVRQLIRPVGDPRQDRRHQNPARDPGGHQLLHRRHARLGA